ncbi:MAG: S26 family signal peptidase [Methanomicrobiales archaeon]
MKESSEDQKKPSVFEKFKKSDNKVVSILREFLWVIIVVGAIAALLFAVSGTWPAVVTIESESMVPHMNVGDLVFVVQADRFGTLQSWTEGKESGYTKFGDYGDVIIYNPNGGTNSPIPFIGGAHPIIHRAMVYEEPGSTLVAYVNPSGGKHSPTSYIPITKDNFTAQGSIIPSPDPDIGFIVPLNSTNTHGGYITKGDNNWRSDQGSGLSHYASLGAIEPVKQEWIVGKALFTIPLVGYLPLNIIPVAIIIILLIILHEWYLHNKQNSKSQVKPGKKNKNKK